MGVLCRRWQALVLCGFLSVSFPSSISIHRSAPSDQGMPHFSYASHEVWSYLRKGLCYLESPAPLLPPERVAPGFAHPGNKGFGAYGFTIRAYRDVQRMYPFFRRHSWEQVLSSARLYELACRAYADLIMRKLHRYIPVRSAPKEVFRVVQHAWYSGVQGYTSGRKILASRTKRARAFLENNMACGQPSINLY